MSTQQEIGWYEKYKSVVNELHELRKTNDKMHKAFEAMVNEHAQTKRQLDRVKEALA